MLSSSALRTLRVATPRFHGKRWASHEAPQYNEPTGWLFGEKVNASNDEHVSFHLPYPKASATRPKASEGRLGKYMVHRDVRVNGVRGCDVVLQTRHKV